MIRQGSFFCVCMAILKALRAIVCLNLVRVKSSSYWCNFDEHRAIEVDLSGNVNSSHIMGKNIMNGIGGSGDFTRAVYISIYTCPSVAKGGIISAIVPNVSHCDHSEHSVNVIVTEYGVADLRCKSPYERANEIIEKCAHPDYRDLLRKFLKDAPMGHTPQTLARAYAFHEAFVNEGDMRKAVL